MQALEWINIFGRSPWLRLWSMISHSWFFFPGSSRWNVLETKELLSFQWKQNPDVLGLILAGRLAAYTCSFPSPSFAGADTKGGYEGGKWRDRVCLLTLAINTWRGQRGKSVQTNGPGVNTVLNQSQAPHMQAYFYQVMALNNFWRELRNNGYSYSLGPRPLTTSFLE